MKRLGRPAIDNCDPSASVHVRLPSKQFDAVDALARKEGTTMPEMIRRAVAELVRHEHDEEE